MFAGHFGLAAAVKAKHPETPLWALMAGTQLLDILFVPLLLSGVETMVPVGEGGYGGSVIHADYTHSLVGALIIALLAGLAAWKWWGKRSAVVIGSLVFSHWLLDLLVHRADLPVLPGNLGNLPLMGFGVWRSPGISMALEIALIAVGSAMYYLSLRSRVRKAAKSGNSRPSLLGRAMWTGAVMAGLLALSLVSDLLGIG
ncbi:permease [Paenibacillus albilobatus]|uniref:Permease n=1 Tax=Paenibacillus albilobatus TaxID=2716884 RepID=A0A919XQ86_9BACL|nr:permease [Paenibacillus albilobatus]GIO34248.1 permease [Paenibacillus albilobatus]